MQFEWDSIVSRVSFIVGSILFNNKAVKLISIYISSSHSIVSIYLFRFLITSGVTLFWIYLSFSKFFFTSISDWSSCPFLFYILAFSTSKAISIPLISMLKIYFCWSRDTILAFLLAADSLIESVSCGHTSYKFLVINSVVSL